MDIEEVARSSENLVEILEGFVRDNLEFIPFERFIIDMTNIWNNIKEENTTLLQTLT